VNERRLAMLEERIDANPRLGKARIAGKLESLVEAVPVPGTAA
jgi:hypothetical protein